MDACAKVALCITYLAALAYLPVDTKRHGKLQLAIATLPAAVMGSIDPQANWKVSPT